MASNKKSIFPLLWVMLFDHTSLNITFPVLTLLFFDAHSHFFSADQSHATRSLWYGMCIAVPHVVNIIMAPLWSALSDEFGRKKILLIATAGAFLFALLAGISILLSALSLFFIARVIQGAFSRTNPIAQAVIGDISPASMKVRNMGYLQFTISLGAFIGPIIGGAIASVFFFHLNFAMPYFLAALFASIGFFLTQLYFSETLIRNDTRKWQRLNFQTIKTIIKNPQIIMVSIILLLTQISWSLYYQFIPPILKTTQYFSATHLGLFVGLIAFWLALATGFGIRFLEKYFRLRGMLLLSLYLILLGLILTLCAFYEKWFALWWLAAIPTALGDAIVYSCLTALYSNCVPSQEQGQVMGVCFIIVATIWSLTGLVGGVLMSSNDMLPLCIAPLGIVLALVLLHRKYLHLGKNFQGE